jgi:hypothetical protein
MMAVLSCDDVLEEGLLEQVRCKVEDLFEQIERCEELE